MLYDGIKLTDSSQLSHAAIESGSTYPNNPEIGQLFYLIDSMMVTTGLYIFNGTGWVDVAAMTTGFAANSIMSSAPLTTSDIAEGKNLYFTTTRAQDSISTSGLGLSYLAGVVSSNATSANTPSTLVFRDSQGNFSAGTITANLTGTASSATSAVKLTTARSIAATGDATWSVMFDGSAATSAALTLASVNTTPGTFGSSSSIPVLTVNAKGLVTGSTSTPLTVAFSAITSKPTTLSGYGITDAQPLSAALTSLSSLSGNGLVAGTNTYTTRTLLASGVGITVVNGDGALGNPVVVSNATSSAVPSTLVARDASGNISGAGITATTFTGAGTGLTGTAAALSIGGNAATSTKLSTARTISATGDANYSVSFDGSANATSSLTLATVNSSPVTGSFSKVTVNGKGLVTATSAVSSTDITTSLGYTPANKAGDTFTGPVILAADPTTALGAVTKQYVDAAVTSITANAATSSSTGAGETVLFTIEASCDQFGNLAQGLMYNQNGIGSLVPNAVSPTQSAMSAVSQNTGYSGYGQVFQANLPGTYNVSVQMKVTPTISYYDNTGAFSYDNPSSFLPGLTLMGFQPVDGFGFGMVNKLPDYSSQTQLSPTVVHTRLNLGKSTLFKNTQSNATAPLTDFTRTTRYTVPDGITTLTALIVGGGGGGGGCFGSGDNHAGGGGGSGGFQIVDIPVTPGETLMMVVGDGGGPAAVNNGSTGLGYSCYVSNSTYTKDGGTGGDTYIMRGTTVLAVSHGGLGGIGDVGDNGDGAPGAGGLPNGVAGQSPNPNRNSYPASLGGIITNSQIGASAFRDPRFASSTVLPSAGAGGNSNGTFTGCPTAGQAGLITILAPQVQDEATYFNANYGYGFGDVETETFTGTFSVTFPQPDPAYVAAFGLPTYTFGVRPFVSNGYATATDTATAVMNIAITKVD
jgi:hypothetical protein